MANPEQAAVAGGEEEAIESSVAGSETEIWRRRTPMLLPSLSLSPRLPPRHPRCAAASPGFSFPTTPPEKKKKKNRLALLVYRLGRGI